MIVERLSLANFRGFDQLDITFDKRVTVLAGVNGVGKSGLLLALAGLLSRALPEFTPSKAQPIAFSDDDVQVGANSMQVDATLVVDDLRCRAGVQHVRGATDNWYSFWSPATAGEGPAQSFAEMIASRTLTGDLDAADTEERRHLAELRGRPSQPIAIYFSTRRDLPGTPRTLPTLQAQDLASAYGYALQNREIALRDIMHWFRVQESEYGTVAGVRVLDRLREVVRAFAPAFTDLRVEDGPPLRFAVTKGDVPLDLRMLSDGERSLLALLFDLTRRLAIANPNEPDPIANGRAVVLIDELEHHLHPSWQRRVLKLLTDTFKGCQFIATTHAPLVIGETPARSVRVLLREGERVVHWQPHYTKGLDANRMLGEVFDTPARDDNTKRQLKSLGRLIDDEEFDKARKKIERLTATLGPDEPELVRAQALIAFLEDDA